MDILIEKTLDLRVYHIAGVKNDVADALSRKNHFFLAERYPSIKTLTYTPPLHLDGAIRS